VDGRRDAADEAPPGRRRPRRETPTERRDRHAAETDPGVVLQAAVRLLQARSRSVAETRRRLSRTGYAQPLVEAAVARLVELGILDDEAFARAWLESRDRARPRGERALRQELALQGVDRDTITAALVARRGGRPGESAGADAASADEVAAVYLLERRAGPLLRLADLRVRRQRAYALLARNGFDPAICADVAARFVADAPPDGSDGA
jgi:regulatory protein